MKGEALPDRIAELEEIFELHRDNAKIRRMKNDVEEYEPFRQAESSAALAQAMPRREKVRESNEPSAKNHTRRTSKTEKQEANRLDENASRLKNK